MKISFTQLPHHLKKTLSSLYLIVSYESILLQEASEQIVQTAQEKYTTLDHLTYHIDSQFHWPSLEHIFLHRSLFSEKTLIELQILEKKMNAQGQKYLIDFSTHFAPDKILLITIQDSPTHIQTTKWLQPILSTSVFIPIWAFSNAQFISWIQQTLLKYHIKIDSSSLHLIARCTENNYFAAKQVIEKLKLLHKNEEPLSHQTIQDLLSDQPSFNIFILIESIRKGEPSRVLHIFNILQKEHIEPLLVLWSLTQEIRLLIEIKAFIEHTQSIDTILKKQKIPIQQKHWIQMIAKRHSFSTLINFLQQAMNIDQMIKGLHCESPWNACQKLGLNLCGYFDLP